LQVAYVVDLQVVDVNTINDFVMSEAVQASTNILLKQDWHKMVADVVKENQRQLVNFTVAGVAFAPEQFHGFIECSDEDRMEAWFTFSGMDQCYTTALFSAGEPKTVDFYGILAGAGGEAMKRQE